MTHPLTPRPTTSRPRLTHDRFTKRTIYVTLLACVALICASSQAAAQAGHLDTTFARNGVFTFSVTTNNGSANQATAVAVQSDGKIVVAGQLGNRSGLLRLNTNGTLDTTFGNGGTVITKIGSTIDQAFVGLAIQSDGKIVLAATGLPPRGEAARFNTDGSTDTTFGTDGITTLPLVAGALALQSDGKIVVAGSALITRLLSDGHPDTSFGTNGLAALVAGPSAIALQSDGKILVGSGGFGAAPVLNPLPAPGELARYNANGSLDKSFGISGQAASVVAPSALAVQSDGKILAAGAIVSQLRLMGDSSGFGMVRFNSNGSVDTTFGVKGGVTSGFPNTTVTGAFAAAIQSNGDIVAAGEAGNPANNGTSTLVESFALARYLGTGRLDSTFGTGGLVTTSFGNSADALISSVALQSDGKIVAAGTNGGGTVEVARYLGQ